MGKEKRRKGRGRNNKGGEQRRESTIQFIGSTIDNRTT